MKPGEETLGEASQMLRDILQNKEKQQQQQAVKKKSSGEGNNNTLKAFHSSTNPYSPQQPPLGSSFCTSSDSEMINSMMRGKSSSSKANSEDNDVQSVHNLSGEDSDVDSFAGTQSGDDAPADQHTPAKNKEEEGLNGEREEEDEEGDVPASPNGDDSVSLSVMSASPDSKEAKRARVENILTTIRQSPLQGGGEFGVLDQNTPLEMKRQKRKQTQPQQHDVRSLLAPDSKYRKVMLNEHIRQLQQQLHAFTQMASCESDNDDDVCDDVADSPDNFLRVSTADLRNKESVSPAANGISPRSAVQPARDDPLLLASSTPLRANVKTADTSPADLSLRLKAREAFGAREQGFDPFQNGNCFPMFPFPPPSIQSASFQRVHALTVKSEIMQAVSKVLEKHFGTMNNDTQQELVKSEAAHQEQRQQQQQQQQQQLHEKQQQEKQQQQQQQEKQQREREQQQHQQQQQPMHQSLQKHLESLSRPLSAPRAPKPEREALKETISHSQTEPRGSELVIPYPDHLNFLERFSSSRLPEKISAFEPLHPYHHHHGPHRGNGPEVDLLRPHSSSALAFPPQFSYSYMQAGLLPPMFPPEPEQTEAMSLVVSSAPKKKRTKVTDTRLSPRAKSALLGEGLLPIPGLLGHDIATSLPSSDLAGGRHPALPSPFPHPFLPPVLPTSVAIANPSLQRSDLFNFRFHESMLGDSHLGGSPPMHDRSSPQSPLLDNSSSSLLRSSADVFDSNPDSMDGPSSQKISFCLEWPKYGSCK
jgi:hypothetical protein